MAQPFDYTFKQQGDPFGSTMKGVETALGMATYAAKQKQSLAEAALKQQELEQTKNMQMELGALARNPNATATDFTEIMIKYPSLSKDLEKSWGVLSAEQKNNEVSYGSQVLFALEGGQPDMAKNLINERITALRNAGREEDAKKQEVLMGIIDTNPDAAKVSTNLALVAAMGPDKYQELRGKIETERRAAEKAPFELGKIKAETVIKEAEAKFAPEKFGAELQLTQSQIESAKAARRASDAAAKKSGAEAKRASAEANQIAAGIIPADKRPEAEGKFRKEYSDQTKGYQEVKSAYGRVLASDQTAAGDIALIFNYMKMLDPGSVVREGEFATAQNAGGVDAKVYNLYNQLMTGERLKPEQRKMFTKQAENLYTQAGKQEAVVRQGIERIAKGYGLKTENIFYTPTEEAPKAPSSFTVTLPNGQVATFPNQQALDAYKKAAGL